MTDITIKIEGAALASALNELSGLLIKAPQSVGHRLVELIEGGAKLGILENDRSSALRAGEFVMLAKPSDGLLDLLAALRTGNFDLAIIEQAFGHKHSSVGQDTDGTASPAVAS